MSLTTESNTEDKMYKKILFHYNRKEYKKVLKLIDNFSHPSHKILGLFSAFNLYRRKDCVKLCQEIILDTRSSKNEKDLAKRNYVRCLVYDDLNLTTFNELFKYIPELESNIDHVDSIGNTVLMVAASIPSNDKNINFIINTCKTNPFVVNEYNESALSYMIENYNLKSFDMCIKYIDPNYPGLANLKMETTFDNYRLLIYNVCLKYKEELTNKLGDDGYEELINKIKYYNSGYFDPDEYEKCFRCFALMADDSLGCSNCIQQVRTNMEQFTVIENKCYICSVTPQENIICRACYDKIMK